MKPNTELVCSCSFFYTQFMFHSMRLSVSYGHNRPGQMASPPTNPLRHTHTFTCADTSLKLSLGVWSWLLLPVPVLALFCRSEQQERATSVPRSLVMSVQK